MSRNELRYFAQQVANEISIELSRAGHEEAARFIGADKMIKDRIRRMVDDFLD